MYLKYMMHVYESATMKFNAMHNECMTIVGRKRKGRKKWDGGRRGRRNASSISLVRAKRINQKMMQQQRPLRIYDGTPEWP